MKMSRALVQKKLGKLLREYRTRDAYPLLVLIIPVVFLMIIDPNSFAFIWFCEREIGRAGFLFLFFLVAWDFHDSRERFKMRRSKWRYALAGVVLIGLLVFYVETVFNTDALRVWVTSQLGVAQESPLSFLLGLEFLFYAAFCVLVTAILYSPSSTLLMATPVIYAVGSGILDLMDAFFPEDSLAFMQIWVYVIWDVVVFILSLLGYHTRVAAFSSSVPPSVLLQGNRLFLRGYRGDMTLVIFWPSSGVVSMIVYSLVILVLMVKLDAPRPRKALYAAFGAIGTYFVNVIRIMFIVLYVTYISLDFEAFHQSIGEVLFIAWIFIYLLLVIRMENARYKKQTPAESPTRPTRDPRASAEASEQAKR